MKQTMMLISRNLKRYFRDKSMLGFSLLTMGIVIVLMVVFLGNMSVESIISNAEEYGITTDNLKSKAEIYVLMWTMAGVLSVNTIMVTLTVIGCRINDTATYKIQSFYVSPLSSLQIATGYIGAAWVCSMLIGIITLGISEAIVVAKGAEPFDFITLMRIIGMVGANSFTYSALMYFASQFVKSESAWSGFGTIIGTLSGFLGGIYIPIGTLPTGVQSFLKGTPIIYGTSMLMGVTTEKASDALFKDFPAIFAQNYNKSMGVNIYINGKAVPILYEVCIILIFGALLVALSAIISHNKHYSDR